MIGAILGAAAATGALSGIGGAFNASSTNEGIRKGREALKSSWKEYQAQNQAIMDYLDEVESRYGTKTAELEAKAMGLIGNGPGQFTPQDLNEATQELLDPNVNYRIERAQEAMENSAAGRNSLLSGATQKALQDRSQKIAQDAWESARNAALQKQNADLAVFQANEGAKQNSINNILSMYNSNLSQKGAAEQMKAQQMQNYGDQTMNYGGALANLNAGQKSTAGGFFTGFAQGASPWASAFGK